jgi:excisionase family DNA binding protein
VIEKELPQVLTAHEVAEILKLDVETVQNLLEQGEVHGAKLGGEWRVRLEDVEGVFDRSGVGKRVVSETRGLPEGSQQAIPSSNLLFWTVLSSVVGSVLWAASWVGFAMWSRSGYEESWAGLASPVELLSLLLFLGGLVGFRARQAAGRSWLGRIGFFLAFSGLALGILCLLPTTVIDLSSEEATAQARAIMGVSVLVAILGFCVHCLGMILLGVATLRARVLPSRWRAVPLVCSLLMVCMPIVLLIVLLGWDRGLVSTSTFIWVFVFLLITYGVSYGMQGYSLYPGGGRSLSHILEGRMERLVGRLDQSAFFQLLEYAGKLTILVALIFYILNVPEREETQRLQAWQAVLSADEQESSGGRIEAMEGLNGDGVSLDGVVADKADLYNVNLYDANLTNAHFREADLSEANLRNANLERADLHQAILDEANLEKADLTAANLSGASLLNKVKLRGSTLVGVNFLGADLVGANLQEADLANANLKQADMKGADLSEASLGGAKMRGAYIDSTDLREVKNLTQAQVDEAAGNEQTQLPSDLQRPSWWNEIPQLGETIPAGEYSSHFFEPVLSFDMSEGWDEGAYTDRPDELRLEQNRNNSTMPPTLRFSRPLEVFDPRDPSSEKLLPAPVSVDEMVDWFQTNPYLDATEPVATTIGGVSGKQFDVDVSFVPEHYPIRSCSEPCVPFIRRSDTRPVGFAQGAKRRLMVLDVEGEVVVVNIASAADEFEEFLPKAQRVLDSVQWRE